MKAYRTTIVKSERGWGTQIDDYMICLTRENAKNLKKNSIATLLIMFLIGI